MEQKSPEIYTNIGGQFILIQMSRHLMGKGYFQKAQCHNSIALSTKMNLNFIPYSNIGSWGIIDLNIVSHTMKLLGNVEENLVIWVWQRLLNYSRKDRSYKIF